MEAIFSSKLYKSSRRKDKIASALADPVNLELVQQLREYLDQPEDVAKDIREDNYEAQVSVGDVPEEVEEVPEEKVSEGFHEIIPAETTEDSVPESENASESEEIKIDETPEELRTFHAVEEKEEDKEDKVEESAKIQAATTLYTAPEIVVCSPCDLVDADAIKGTLNLKDDTKGVSRIFVRDNELWIYYQDKINLNSVMEPVIYALNAENYSYLEFNRLARSDNAIVFEIGCIPQPVKPIVEEEK